MKFRPDDKTCTLPSGDLECPLETPSPAAPALDCQRCGACCAVFRVSFYWAEADDAPGGTVPVQLTRQVSPHLRCMAGTEAAPVRCVALLGEVGRRVACGIYAQRASTCRGVMPGDAQCRRAREALGLDTATRA